MKTTDHKNFLNHLNCEWTDNGLWRKATEMVLHSWLYKCVNRAGRGLVVTKTLPNQQTDLTPMHSHISPSLCVTITVQIRDPPPLREFLATFPESLSQKSHTKIYISCCRAVKRRPTAAGRGAFFARNKKGPEESALSVSGRSFMLGSVVGIWLKILETYIMTQFLWHNGHGAPKNGFFASGFQINILKS